jgi:hypothetical protein
MTAAARVFVGLFGLLWFVLSDLNIELGQRTLEFTIREWTYVASSIAGFLLISLSFVPRSILVHSAAKWVFALIIGFVELGILLVVYRNLSRSYNIYLSLAAGAEFAPERASPAMQRYLIAGLVAIILGAALGLSAKRLLAPQENRTEDRR